MHVVNAIGVVECEQKHQKTRFHVIFVAFFLRLAELFFLAGCAEPRCGDFKEGNSKFQGNASFSVSKGRPGPQISESGEHVSFSGNRVSLSGKHVSFSGTRGARGAAP